jgi:two-component system, NtrC family, sensor histidine kinase GlrK
MGENSGALAVLGRHLQPRSLRALVLIAFLVVALPLIGAVGYSVSSSTRVTTASERLVSSSIETTALSESIGELMLELERNGRQYTITRSPELLGVYELRRRALLEATRSLEALNGATPSIASFDTLRRAIERIDGYLGEISTSEPAASADLAKAFAQARGAVADIQLATREALEHRLRALVRDEQHTSRLLIGLSLGLAVGAVLLAIGLTAIIARPMSDIARAIHSLGDSSADLPIAIAGPRDLQRVGEEIEWLREELGRLDAARTRLLQHVSHELKTPLASIVEASELLTDGTVDADGLARVRVVRILQDNVSRLHRLIDRLLDLAASPQPDGEAVQRPVLLRDLLLEAANDHRLAIERRGLRVDVEVIPNGLTIRADPQRMRAALENLISNAVKYSPPGGAIDVRAERRDGRLRIDVVDEGPGIPVAERSRVFEPFYRVDRGATASIPGTGIGLSIVQAAIRAHGGEISILDGPGGAHLRIDLPDNHRR